MNWTLAGSIAFGIVTLIGGTAGVFQIIQYFEQRQTTLRASQGRSSISQVLHEPSKERSLLVTTPNNLPPRSVFIGREDKKKELYTLMKSTTRIVIVEGATGIGKTSLALEVAYRCVGESLINHGKGGNKISQFNAFIWITAKAGKITIDNVLDIISRTLDYPYISQLQIEDKFNEGINLLRKTRTLLIIDNFETIIDTNVTRFIENIPDSCKVIITTKYQRTWNVPFTPLSLDKLQLEEGIELIVNEIKRLGLNLLLQNSQKPLIDLYDVTGGSPLAIKWAVGQIKQRGQSLKSIIETLREARGDIFATMFAESWTHLSDASKHVLLAMPLFAATVSRAALAAVADIHGFDDALGYLVELWLIESNRELLEEKQRFSIHSLTRSFITRELSKIPLLEDGMHKRAVKYYLHFCNERRYLQRGSKDHDEIEDEVANILKVLEWLYDDWKSKHSSNEICQFIVDYSNAINDFFWSRGFWGERVFLCKQALEASKSLKDWKSAGRQAYLIGIVRFWQGGVAEAEQWEEISRSFITRTGDSLDLALTQRLLGLIEMEKGNYSEATNIHKAVLEKISKNGSVKNEDVSMFAEWICPGPEGYKAGQVSLMQDIGIVANRQGDYLTAKQWLEGSVVLAQQIGDVEGLSVSLSHLGNALYGLQQFTEAKIIYSKGLELATQVRRKSTMGRCNQGLANVSSINGNLSEISRYGKEAMNLFERLGMQREKQDIENLLNHCLK